LALEEGRYADAIGLFEQITPESKHFGGGLYLQVEAARRWAEAEGTEERYALLQSMASHHRTMLFQIMEGWSGKRVVHFQQLRDRMLVFEAEAWLELKDPEQALALLKELEGEKLEWGIDAKAILAVRLTALGMLDRSEDAREAVERFLRVGGGEAMKAVGTMLENRMGLQQKAEDEQGGERAKHDLRGLAEGLEGWLRGRDEDELKGVGPDIWGLGGEAFRVIGAYDRALPLYAEAIRDRPHSLRWLYGRAECLFLQQDAKEEMLAEAMGIYRRVVAGGATVGAEYYWGGQVRMLEILDRMGRNTHRILPRIQRLRREDPGLGGERFRQEFEQLQEKYGARN